MKSNSLRLCLLAVGLSLASCASWDATRQEIIKPLNQLVHFDYPEALRSQASERVAQLFSPELAEWAAEDAREIAGRFTRIDRCRCVIYDATSPDDTGAIRTDCVVRLDGLIDGTRVTWRQERAITARPILGEWRIIEIELGKTLEPITTTVFEEEAQERGLIAHNRSRGTLDRAGVEQTFLASAGVSVGDADGDGLDDLLMLSGDKIRLFLNRGGEFEDVTERSGLITPETGECRCGYFADIDGDGDQDLFVAIFLGTNLLFVNDGDAVFHQVFPEESGLITEHGQTSSACFGDFDGDGDLDLVLANGSNIYTTDPEPKRNARNGFADQFFRNNGDGTFYEATEEVGLGETGWALAVSASDIDKDGDLDLFIGNDIGNDVMYLNRGDGTFEDISESAGVVYAGSSMSADFGDVNGDGWPDLYVSGMASNSRWILRLPGFPLPVPFPLDVMFRSQIVDVMWEMFHGNRLYLNNQDGTFREVSKETRSDWLGWAWASLFLDYDNDGFLDIYCANGMWTGEEATDC